ncbi:MAG: protein kinase, partial [Pseudomonadota bacterium]
MTLPVSEAIEGIDLTVDELAVGETLMHGQYTIENFLNAGGFGITYTARDSLDRLVVIKECFPSDYCRRSKTVVHARSRAHESKLRSLLRLFIQEARSLSKLDHPNIVGVHQVFEENNTAYMALDYVEGDDLFEVVENDPGRYDPAQIETMLRKLLTAVGFIHARGILHRDISPDNIIVDPSMEPVLIDFGAAREQATREGRPLSALLVVKDGYSPHEFYGGGGSQGPSSDLYALAATFYHLISGEMPPISQDRLSALAADEPDPCKPLLGRIEGHDDAFLAALDQAMAPLPKDRIESAEDWLAKIDKPEAKSMLRPDLAAPRDVRTLAAAALGVVAIGLIGAVMTLGGGSEEETPRAAVASAETDADAAPVEEAPAPVDVAEAEAVVADPAPEAAPVETAEAEAADTSAIAELEDVAAAMMWGEALSPSAPTSLAEVPPGTA